MPEREDSAGIAVLRHRRGAVGDAPLVTVDSTVITLSQLSVGSEQTDVSQFAPVLFFADGRIVARDVSAHRIGVFGADGVALAFFGRRGSGPHEFRGVGGMVRDSRESLLVADVGNARVTLVHATQGALRSYSLSASPMVGGHTPLGWHGGGLLVWGYVMPSTRDGAGASQPGVRVVRIDTLTSKADIVFASDPTDTPLTMTDRRPLVLYWNAHFVVVDGNTRRIDWRDTTGRLVRTLRIDEPRTPIDEELWQQIVSNRVAEVVERPALFASGQRLTPWRPGISDTAALRRSIAAEPHGDSLPATLAVHLTAGGTLWVVEHPIAKRDGWRALAIDFDGRIIGRIVQRDGRAPVLFGDDLLLSLSEDSDGSTRWMTQRLRWPGRALD